MKIIKLFVVLFFLGATSSIFAQVDHFLVEGFGGGAIGAQTAGTSFNIRITAQTLANATVAGFTGTVNLTTNAGTIAPTVSASFVAGVLASQAVTVTLAATLRTITVTETSGTATGTSNTFTVAAGAFTKLQLLVPGEAAAPGTTTGKTGTPSASTAGTAFPTVTVNAVDANWNLVSSTNTVGITSSDANAALQANTALVAGTQTFTVTLKTAGSATITATDITDGTKTANTSPSITVNAGAFSKLQLLVPGEIAAPGTATGKTGAPSNRSVGISFTVTVNAVDANWNLVNTIVDNVGITSTGGTSTLPANNTLVAGTQTFSVSLNTVGAAISTLTATDITDGAKTANTSPSITVTVATATKYIVTSSSYSPVAGTGVTITAQLADVNNNSVSTAGLVVTWTKSDANGSFATPTSLTNASGIATVVFTTHTVPNTATTVTGTDGGALTGTSGTITTIPTVPTLTAPAQYAVGVSILPTLSWTGALGATFEMQISTSSTFTSTIAINPAYVSPATSYNFLTNFLSTANTMLANGTTYYWRVRQTISGQTSAWTSREFVTVVAAKPTLNPITPGTTSAFIAWYPVPYSAGLKYDLYYSVNADMSSPTSVLDLTVTYYTITGLVQGTNYYVQVEAKNTAGTIVISYSLVSGPFAAAAPPKPTPSYPTDPATDGPIYANPPTLFWYISGNEPALTYDIEVQLLATPFTGVPTVSSTKTFKTLTASLTAGSTYHWQVRSVSGAVNSAWSTVSASFTMYSNVATSTIVPTPSWPVGNPTVYFNPPTLYWYLASDKTGLYYNVELSLDGLNGGAGTAFTTPIAVAGWSTDLFKALPTTLLPNQIYYWHVRSSLSSLGTSPSAWSTSGSFTIAATASGAATTPIPSWPTGGVIMDGPMANITLSWTAYSTQALDFKVRMATSSSVDVNGQLNHGSAVETLGWVATTTSANAAGVFGAALTAGATYYWQVRSRLTATPAVYSPWSMVASFSTAAGSSSVVPLVISPNYLQPINNTSAILTWNIPVPTETHLKYDLQYAKDENFSSAVTKTNLNEPVMQVTGLETNSTYYWRVLSKTDNGSISSYSTTGTFKTSGATAVEDNEVIPTQFKLSQNYPNPFNPTTRITYALPQNVFVSIKVYDMLGREVKSLVNNEMAAGNHSIEWKGEDNGGSKVASGTYIYRITAGNFVAVKKMVLIK